MDAIGIQDLFESASEQYVESFIERIESKISRSGNCHEWQGRTNKWGHARIRFKNKKILAHRAIWVIENGEIGNSQVNHNCGNPKCLNTDHLYVGSQAENAQDMAKHGNQRNQKLTPSDVREIRKRYTDDDVTQSELGDEYGVGQHQISRIVNGERWSHI